MGEYDWLIRKRKKNYLPPPVMFKLPVRFIFFIIHYYFLWLINVLLLSCWKPLSTVKDLGDFFFFLFFMLMCVRIKTKNNYSLSSEDQSNKKKSNQYSFLCIDRLEDEYIDTINKYINRKFILGLNKPSLFTSIRW